MEVKLHEEGEESTDPGLLALRGRTVAVPPHCVQTCKRLFDWLIKEHGVKECLTPTLPVSAGCAVEWLTVADLRLFYGLDPLWVHANMYHFRAHGTREGASKDSTSLWEVETAFEMPYQCVSNVDILHSLLQNTVAQDQNLYAPAVGLFQSSGWGKSRTTCELWRKDVWVVYCSFAHRHGYPRRAAFSDWFEEQCCAAHKEGEFACMNFSLLFFIACIFIVEERMLRNESCQSFVTELWKGKEAYWEEVKSQIDRFRGSKMLTRLEKIGDRMNWESTAESLVLDCCVSTRKKIVAPKKLHILFVFDEARHLVTKGIFVPIRRSTRALHPLGVCVLFMDTSAQITNFTPTDSADSSDRVSMGHVLIAPPIWGCFLADLAENDSYNPLKNNKFSGITGPFQAVQYGRPLWWAMFKSLMGQDESLIDSAFYRTYKLAKEKVLGGHGTWYKYIVKGDRLTPDVALTLLGATIGINVDPRSIFASKLVASNLLTVVSVSADGELVWTAWSPEPLVAMAANEAIRALHSRQRHQELYTPLVEGLQAGWVDRDYQGEVAARIILLDAMVKALGPELSGCCTVDAFCQSLLGQSLLQLVGSKSTEHEKKLAHSRLHFNSFHRIYKKSSELDLDDIRMCIERKCAVICKGGTWGDDIWMFAFTGSDDEELNEGNITAIHGQVKLKTGTDSKICYAKMSPQFTGLKVLANLPYLSLYMNVVDKGKEGVRACLVDSGVIASAVMKSNLGPIKEALSKAQEPADPMDSNLGPIKEALSEQSKAQEPADPMDIDRGPNTNKPSVQAWKAWLQTVVVVKELNGFSLDAKLKGELKKIIRASKNPFLTDPKNNFHKESLELQKDKLQDMFTFVNLHKFN